MTTPTPEGTPAPTRRTLAQVNADWLRAFRAGDTISADDVEAFASIATLATAAPSNMDEEADWYRKGWEAGHAAAAPVLPPLEEVQIGWLFDGDDSSLVPLLKRIASRSPQVEGRGHETFGNWYPIEDIDGEEQALMYFPAHGQMPRYMRVDVMCQHMGPSKPTHWMPLPAPPVEVEGKPCGWLYRERFRPVGGEWGPWGEWKITTIDHVGRPYEWAGIQREARPLFAGAIVQPSPFQPAPPVEVEGKTP